MLGLCLLWSRIAALDYSWRASEQNLRPPWLALVNESSETAGRRVECLEVSVIVMRPLLVMWGDSL